jgi:hypothetical protein
MTTRVEVGKEFLDPGNKGIQLKGLFQALKLPTVPTESWVDEHIRDKVSGRDDLFTYPFLFLPPIYKISLKKA